jgi:ParB family chromosome partitioning protein
LRTIPIELIGPSPHQPRKRFDEEALAALASSLEVRGVLQPVLVRPLAGGRYELIAGERRWRAAGLAGLEQIPAIVRHDDDAASLELAVIENMAREDLNPVEEARACAALVEDLGLSKEELARRVGRSRPAVSNLIRLLDLPDETLTLLEGGELSEGHGRAVLLVRGNDARRRLARSAASNGWSVRETERRAKLASQPGQKSRNGHRPVHPEEEAAMRDAAERLEEAVGHEVRVRRRGGEVSVEIRLGDLDEAHALARRLGSRKG